MIKYVEIYKTKLDNEIRYVAKVYIDGEEIKSESKYIINNIIHEYGALASWKLSALTHREISWLNSRKGLKKEENGRVKIKNEDIQEDAKKVRPYDYAWDMYYDEFEDYEAVV